MRKIAGFTRVLVLVLAFASGMGIHACGSSNNHKRDRERCESCDPAQIDHDCVTECRKFCAAGEDCDARCNRECDRCKAELECRPCSSGCTGTLARCAPAGEPLTCEDGTF